MALPGVGNSISFLEIRNEFGVAPSFGSYRVQWSNTASGGSLSNQPLDAGIPQAGQIKFSDFNGKKLNVVVNFYDQDFVTGYTGQDIKSRFVQGTGVTTCLGGFKEDVPSLSKIVGAKVIADINRTIGARKKLFTPTAHNTNTCALTTGDWAANQEVIIKVGTNGLISGAGGNGGPGGGSGNSAGKPGDDGCSAIGINKADTIVSIINNGQIRAGFGGGGGGSGKGESRKSGKKSSVYYTSSGGGGGGGAGVPIGIGQTGGPDPRQGGNGANAESFFVGGNGGTAGDSSGAGGHGGDTTPDGIGVGGRAPAGGTAGAAGGAGGLHGFTILTVQATNPAYSGGGQLIPANRTLQNQTNINI